jgi:PAS domain S-box-containing protein
MSQQLAISPRAFRRILAQIALLPAVLLTILVVVFLLQLGSLVRAARLVNHTDQVIREMATIEELLLDQQVSLRGYLVTGDAVYLDEYRASGLAIDSQVATLLDLVADNSAQTTRLGEIDRAYRDWVAFGQTMPAARENGTSATALAGSATRVRAVRDGIDAFVRTEQELLAQRNQQVERSTRVIVLTSIAGVIIVGGLLSLAIWRQMRGLAGVYEGSLADVQRQQAALQESEGRFRDLSNALPQVVWTTYPDGNVAFANQRWYDFTGLTPEGVTGRDWLSPVHPDDRPLAEQRWDDALAAPVPFEVEYRLRRADGAHRWYLVRAVPVRDRANRVAYWVGAGTDIDDHKHTETALRERTQRLAQATKALADRNRELDQFAYVTSHDLKAPLRGIANLSQWIEEDLGDLATGDIRQQLDLLRGRVQRMEALIDGILQFSRVGRVRENIESVEVGALLTETIDLLSPPPGFTIDIGPGMPTLVAERTRLQQVFQNLISNALKHHNRTDGRIEVRAQEGEVPGTYEFTVRDDGPGIAPQYHERIFGIFQTLRPRDQVEGSGLGLALVKKIVEHHGGRIWLESAEGCGTTFHFTWPRQTGREEA